jgi:hypothetical protein
VRLQKARTTSNQPIRQQVRSRLVAAGAAAVSTGINCWVVFETPYVVQL